MQLVNELISMVENNGCAKRSELATGDLYAARFVVANAPCNRTAIFHILMFIFGVSVVCVCVLAKNEINFQATFDKNGITLKPAIHLISKQTEKNHEKNITKHRFDTTIYKQM